MPTRLGHWVNDENTGSQADSLVNHKRNESTTLLRFLHALQPPHSLGCMLQTSAAIMNNTGRYR